MTSFFPAFKLLYRFGQSFVISEYFRHIIHGKYRPFLLGSPGFFHAVALSNLGLFVSKTLWTMMDWFGAEASLFVALHIALLIVVLLDKPRKHGTPENLHVKCSTYLNCLNTWVLQKKVVAIVQSIWFCVKGILSGILFKSLMPVPKASTLQGPNKLPASQREECARQSSPHTFEPATLVNSSSSQDVLWAEELEQKSHQFRHSNEFGWKCLKMSSILFIDVFWMDLDGQISLSLQLWRWDGG